VRLLSATESTINKTNYNCTPSDTTVQYFIVKLLLTASFDLNGPSAVQHLH